jgi:CelD/BcsL family acetyltransferase involved in cellulose biosynthesis
MIRWTLVPYTPENFPSSAYSNLFKEDTMASPFRSPAFMHCILQKEHQAGYTVLLVCGYDGEKLVALLPLRKRGNIFSNIWEEEGDHTAFVYHNELRPQEITGGIDAVLSAYPKAGFVLKNMPYWTAEAHILNEHLNKVRICRLLESWPAPILSAEGEEQPAEALRKAVNKSNLRNYGNRLAKQPGYAFEILTGNEDLIGWAEEFMQHHRTRWNPTPTPSEFNSPQRCSYFIEKLSAWQQDGVLIRFAVKLGDQRIAMCVALNCGKRLIYHYITHDVQHEQSRAASVLIRLIGLWMADNGYEVLDFGVGGENYKYQFINKDCKVLRLYALHPNDWNNRMKLHLDILIRENKTAGEIWNKVVNRFLRIHVKNLWQKITRKNNN